MSDDKPGGAKTANYTAGMPVEPADPRGMQLLGMWLQLDERGKRTAFAAVAEQFKITKGL